MMTTTTVETTEHAQTSVYTLSPSCTYCTDKACMDCTHKRTQTRADAWELEATNYHNARTLQKHTHTHILTATFSMYLSPSHSEREDDIITFFLPSWAAHYSLRRIRTITHYISGNPRRAKARCSGACYSFLSLQLFFFSLLSS